MAQRSNVIGDAVRWAKANGQMNAHLRVVNASRLGKGLRLSLDEVIGKLPRWLPHKWGPRLPHHLLAWVCRNRRRGLRDGEEPAPLPPSVLAWWEHEKGEGYDG